jgi:UDP-2-acetamido-3-amino-2,3-dideoxy-glucuronate N-acetyltransferase
MRPRHFRLQKTEKNLFPSCCIKSEVHENGAVVVANERGSLRTLDGGGSRPDWQPQSLGIWGRMMEASETFIHAAAVVDEGCTIGKGTRIWHFTHVLPHSKIGDNCNIGQNVMIGPGVTIGNRCKIQNNVSVYPGVTLEDGVFCGPSCVFTNVLTPRAEIERKDEFRPTMVKRGASIGANATVVCGTTLGEYCLIGAGAVVTRDVVPFALMLGVPARRVGWVSHAGEILGTDLICPREGRRYALRAIEALEESP